MCDLLILLRAGTSAVSTTTRWSSRVGLTDRPEFRSSPRISPESTGPLSYRNPPMDRPRGVGSIANFNLPKYPRGPTTGEFHPRRNSYGNEPISALVPCAVPSGLIAENRRSRLSRYNGHGSGLANLLQHATCSVNERRDANELKTLNK